MNADTIILVDDKPILPTLERIEQVEAAIPRPFGGAAAPAAGVTAPQTTALSSGFGPVNSQFAADLLKTPGLPL